MDTPDPDSAGYVGRGDPLPIRRETGDSGRVSVVAVDGDLQGITKIEDNNGSAIGVENEIVLGVAGNENTSATLGRRNAGISLRQLRHFEL